MAHGGRHEQPESRFSKARLEMLCDGIFAVAMTLLVLELKPPDLPRHADPAVDLACVAASSACRSSASG